MIAISLNAASIMMQVGLLKIGGGENWEAGKEAGEWRWRGVRPITNRRIQQYIMNLPDTLCRLYSTHKCDQSVLIAWLLQKRVVNSDVTFKGI